MRIPYDVVRDGLSAINHAAEEMALAQQQVSSGQRIMRAGDDPLGTQQAVLERAGLGSTDAYLSSRDAGRVPSRGPPTPCSRRLATSWPPSFPPDSARAEAP
jgi:hypothetical protein